MDAFTSLCTPAVPLPMINVDTDAIIPKQFLKTISRQGLARGLFYDLRRESQSFVLDDPRYAGAAILIAGRNFGCGSSREHAPWALLDHGIRCLIAPSFGDIFANNCYKNGMLPIVLDEELIADFLTQAEGGAAFTVDLQSRQVTPPRGPAVAFAIDDFRRRCLLEALDEIALTLAQENAITAFEQARRAQAPWL